MNGTARYQTRSYRGPRETTVTV